MTDQCNKLVHFLISSSYPLAYATQAQWLGIILYLWSLSHFRYSDRLFNSLKGRLLHKECIKQARKRVEKAYRRTCMNFSDVPEEKSFTTLIKYDTTILVHTGKKNCQRAFWSYCDTGGKDRGEGQWITKVSWAELKDTLAVNNLNQTLEASCNTTENQGKTSSGRWILATNPLKR